MLKPHAFTLIEFIIVIVILAVLGVVIGPKFVNLQSDARQSMIKAVASALGEASQLFRNKWITKGRLGDGNTGRVDIDIDGISVRYRNGYVVNVNTSSHVPNGTPNRNTATTRIFFLFLQSIPGEVISRNSNETGWVMLANGNCAPVTRPRCWEYRLNGTRVNRITYASGEDGRIIID